MYNQPKLAILPCCSNSEHTGDHYLPLTRSSALADVASRVDICVFAVTTRNAEKGGLIGTVLLINVAALRALARGVPGINEDYGDASTFRFIGDERTELRESPVTQSRALVAPGRNPLKKSLELFKGDPSRGAFGIRHDSLGDAVICVFLKPRLFAGELPEFPPRTSGGEFLQAASAFLVSLTFTFNLAARERLAVAVSGQRNNSEVNAQPILGRKLVCFRNITDCRDEPLSAHEAKINFAFAIGHQPPLMFTHDNRYGNATFNRPKINGTPILRKPDDPIIVRLRCVHTEDRRDPPTGLKGIRNLCDAAYRCLSGQTESISHLAVSQPLEIVLSVGLRVKTYFGEPGTGFITSLQRCFQERRLLVIRHHFKGGREFHTLKYRRSSPIYQVGKPINRTISRGEVYEI